MIILIDTYILMNRKPKIILKLFIYNILILIVLVIYVLFNCNYTSYFYSDSKITLKDNMYLLKIMTPISDLSSISQNKFLLINDKEYMYQIYEIEDNLIYEDDSVYQIVYLKIWNLEDYYQINNYPLSIKIKGENKKIINYLY